MTAAHSVAVTSIEELRNNLRMGSYRNAFNSLRAMRRLLERTMVEAYEGQRPTGHITHFSNGVKTAAELFMAEKQLVALGLDMEEVNHPMGHDGGLENSHLEPGLYVTRMESIEEGTSPRGTPVSKHKVSKSGPATKPHPIPSSPKKSLQEAPEPLGDISAGMPSNVILEDGEEIEW